MQCCSFYPFVLQVVITDPYGPENCESINPDDTTALDRVKKVVSFLICTLHFILGTQLLLKQYCSYSNAADS